MNAILPIFREDVEEFAMHISLFALIAVAIAQITPGTAHPNMGSGEFKERHQSSYAPQIESRDVTSLKKSGFTQVGSEELTNVLLKSVMSPVEGNISRETDFAAHFLPHGLMRKTEFEIVPTTRELKWRVSGNSLCITDMNREICRAALLKDDASMLALSVETSSNGAMNLYKLARHSN